MKPETLALILGAVTAVSQILNVYMFLRIRVAQLETEKRILDQVHRDYVPREVCVLPNCPFPAGRRA